MIYKKKFSKFKNLKRKIQKDNNLMKRNKEKKKKEKKKIRN